MTETLSERVAALAGARPDDVAYRWADGALTWQDYDRRATAVAGALVDRGIRPGDRVVVCLPDTGEVHAVLLGCERAGAVAVGVGWRSGAREVEHLTRATGAVLAVLPVHRHREVPVAAVDPAALVAPGADAVAAGDLPGIAVDDLWMLNSTSGTTGLPKCVMQTQARWFFFHDQAVACGELRPGERWMSVLPAPFGFGIWTSRVTPTLLGAPCAIQERFDPAAVAAMIAADRIEVLAAVSSQFVMILDAAGDHDLTSLRVLFTGGERISATRARDFEARTGCTILNFYGSNETGLLSGTRLDDPLERRLTTGGRCIPAMQVRLYDEAGRRLPGDRGRGRPAGKGPALSPGYWDDPAANAELFTDDGWMLMGDIVEIDPDGWLTVVGRTADFVIRGGKNISAAAVEEEVGTHPAVAHAAVVPVPDERLGERIGVFVELHPGTRLDLPTLVTHLADRGVTKEWWPELLVIEDALPRSSGGKIAKGALRTRAEHLRVG